MGGKGGDWNGGKGWWEGGWEGGKEGLVGGREGRRKSFSDCILFSHFVLSTGLVMLPVSPVTRSSVSVVPNLFFFAATFNWSSAGPTHPQVFDIIQICIISDINAFTSDVTYQNFSRYRYWFLVQIPIP